MTTKTKPADKLRLVISLRNEAHDQPPVRLGFINDYRPDLAGWAAKQHTQDNWAYGEAYARKGDPPRYGYHEDGRVYSLRWKRSEVNTWLNDVDDDGKLIPIIEEVPADLQPTIIKNVPMNGFRLVKTVTRYSTSNKVWRVQDPRGFQLEISSANLETLIHSTIILGGLIDGYCVWNGKVLQIVPTPT
jgi:hypothetical protein